LHENNTSRSWSHASHRSHAVLAHGVSVGTEIEFADRVSIARALEGRREL